jgi:hypothetical protein
MLAVPPPGAADPNGPTKILKAQEEKKRQENFLSKIFGLDKAVSIPKPAESINRKPSGVARTSNEGLEHLKKFQSMQEWSKWHNISDSDFSHTSTMRFLTIS